MIENKKLSAPCKSCDNRFPLCHDACDKYKQFKSNRQEIETARQIFKTQRSIGVESVKRCKYR